MTGVRRLLVVVLAASSFVTAACSGDDDEGATAAAETTTTTAEQTTTTESTTTTTEAPTTTIPPTTTAAPTTAPSVVGLAATAAKAALSPTGIVVPILAKSGDAVTVGTPCGRQAVMRSGRPLHGIVVLDAGHGGVEPGAVGAGGLTEKELNLAVTQHAQQALEAAGHPVVLTRAGDYRISLEARAKIVETVKPRAFVSIHYNAEPDGPRAGPGAETYYQTVGPSAAESKRLAGLIYEEIVAAMSQYQGVAWVADSDAGAKYRKNSQGNDYYGILRRTQGTPASLAELGFISNPPEEALYRSDDVRRVAGGAVAKGVIRFLTSPDPGSGFVEPYPRDTPAGGGGGTNNCVDPALE